MRSCTFFINARNYVHECKIREDASSFGYTKYQLRRKLEALDEPVSISNHLVKSRLVIGNHPLLPPPQRVNRERNEQVVSVNSIQQPRPRVLVYLFETRYSLEQKGQVDLEGRTMLYHITGLSITLHLDETHELI